MLCKAFCFSQDLAFAPRELPLEKGSTCWYPGYVVMRAMIEAIMANSHRALLSSLQSGVGLKNQPEPQVPSGCGQPLFLLISLFAVYTGVSE